VDQLVEEPIGIKLHPDDINREERLKLQESTEFQHKIIKEPKHAHTFIRDISGK
jgi:hypothetical protein